MTKILAVIGVLLYAVAVASATKVFSKRLQGQQSSKPHIVFMMVDDWGWADVGYHRNTSSKEVVTPNIDSLVKEGLQLNQNYVYNWCSPTLEITFLTGRVPNYVNEVTTGETIYNPNDPVSGFDGIPGNMTGAGTRFYFFCHYLDNNDCRCDLGDAIAASKRIARF